MCIRDSNTRYDYSTPRMLSIHSATCHTISKKVQALVARTIEYYTKDRLLNTLVIYAAIKIIVLLGAIAISLRYQPAALLQDPMFLSRWDGGWYQGIAYNGYAYNYPCLLYTSPSPRD